MIRETLEKLIDDNMLAAFKAMDQLDWRGYQGSFKELKEKWVDLPQGSSKSSFRSQLKTLLGLHFDGQLHPAHQPHYLTPASADVPSSFLGREDENAKIHELLFQRLQPLALVNAEGGMGKTTLAAYYWQQHAHEYQHLAWLYCERGILSALQSQLPLALGILNDIEQAMKQASAQGTDIQAAIWQTLKTAMANLKAPCLLVLDNANDPEDIRSFLQKIKGLNWHILLTSRCSGVMTDPHSEYSITGLPPDLAKQLFKRNHRETSPDFEDLLDRFLLAVGYNTLCIEVFSKNLAEGSGWGLTMQGLLAKLEIQGLNLGEDSFEINSNWNGQTQNVRSSDQIIEALYNITELERNTPALHQLLATLALLPAEGHSAEVLRTLLPAESPIVLKNELDQLVRWGWLSFAEKTYRLSPVVQKIVLQKITAAQRWALAEPMVKRLKEILEAEGYHPKNIAIAAPFAELVYGLVTNMAIANNEVVALMDCLWFYYTATGNLTRSLLCAQTMGNLCTKFNEQNGLAISYERLGDTHKSLGNLETALTYFKEYERLEIALSISDPQNVLFKKNLAVSYCKIGNMYTEMGNLEKALAFFDMHHELAKTLHETNSKNVEFKKGLAISNQKLGETHKSLGNFETALMYFEISNDLINVLNAYNPQSIDFKNGLAVSYCKIGETHTSLGNFETALIFYEKFKNLIEVMQKSHPQNVEFKKVLEHV